MVNRQVLPDVLFGERDVSLFGFFDHRLQVAFFGPLQHDVELVVDDRAFYQPDDVGVLHFLASAAAYLHQLDFSQTLLSVFLFDVLEDLLRRAYLQLFDGCDVVGLVDAFVHVRKLAFAWVNGKYRAAS